MRNIDCVNFSSTFTHFVMALNLSLMCWWKGPTCLATQDWVWVKAWDDLLLLLRGWAAGLPRQCCLRGFCILQLANCTNSFCSQLRRQQRFGLTTYSRHWDFKKKSVFFFFVCLHWVFVSAPRLLSSCCEWRLPFISLHGLLTAVASLAVDWAQIKAHSLQ